METPKNNIEHDLTQLEARIDELTAVCNRLQTENRSLVERLELLTTERASLMQKNEQARSGVEAIIGRLKTLEHNV